MDHVDGTGQPVARRRSTGELVKQRRPGRSHLHGWIFGTRRFRRWCCTLRRWSGSPGARRACPARRTLRTNLRFIGRRVVPQFCPADLPLPRERAKKPYSPAEIAGLLALADAQPTTERRMRAAVTARIDSGGLELLPS